MAIADSTKLYIYNEALLTLGSRKLSALTENHERRRILDQGWGDGSEHVVASLALASWNHAMRGLKMEYDPAIDPAFGPKYAFQKPTDLVRLEGLSYNEHFTDPLTNRDYTTEAGYWYAHSTPLYAKFVSKDTDYGFDSSIWPVTFMDVVAARLARKCCYSVTGSTKMMRDTYTKEEEALSRARGVDALEEGVKVPTTSNWVKARGRSHRGRDTYVES